MLRTSCRILYHPRLKDVFSSMYPVKDLNTFFRFEAVWEWTKDRIYNKKYCIVSRKLLERYSLIAQNVTDIYLIPTLLVERDSTWFCTIRWQVGHFKTANLTHAVNKISTSLTESGPVNITNMAISNIFFGGRNTNVYQSNSWSMAERLAVLTTLVNRQIQPEL